MGGDAAEVGNGPGSYDIDQSVWHVNVRSSPLFNLNSNDVINEVRESIS